MLTKLKRQLDEMKTKLEEEQKIQSQFIHEINKNKFTPHWKKNIKYKGKTE